MNRHRMHSALICLLLLIALPAAADVYTYIDAQGNRVFTDQPRKNATRVDIPPSNNMTGTPPTRTLKAHPAKPAVQPMFHYQLLRILVPEPDATLVNPSGDLIVTVTSEPVLQPGHSYRLLLDGVAVGEAGRSPVFPLSNVDRGTHQLSVEIFDELGRVLEKRRTSRFTCSAFHSRKSARLIPARRVTTECARNVRSRTSPSLKAASCLSSDPRQRRSTFLVRHLHACATIQSNLVQERTESSAVCGHSLEKRPDFADKALLFGALVWFLQLH